MLVDTNKYIVYVIYNYIHTYEILFKHTLVNVSNLVIDYFFANIFQYFINFYFFLNIFLKNTCKHLKFVIDKVKKISD